MIRILLVDDQVLFREGLRKVISDWDDFNVIGETSNGKEALELCRKFLPDIVLMDINMPVMNGVEAAKLIHKELPSVRVVILTVSEDEKDLFDAIKFGAQGYILKDTPARRLRSQIKGVMNNEAPLSGIIAAKLLSEFSHDNRSGRPAKGGVIEASIEPLTERETEILILVAEGHSNLEIAETLVISEQTVKKHMHNVLEKLHFNSRVQAAVYAVRSGLI
jgi:DNA-binding NarL/FixJ family response regulator